MDSLKTLLIIPCYQLEDRFKFDEFVSPLDVEKHLGLCFVNDGSTDKTLNYLLELQSLYPNKVQVLTLKENLGKAEAVRYGMQNADFTGYDFTGYFDGDLAYPLTQVKKFFNEIPANNIPDMVVGARVKLFGSTNIRRNVFRHLFSRFFATIVSTMLKIGIYDTQTGAKLIRVTEIAYLFEEKFISKWLFDIELIYRFIAHNGRDNLSSKMWELPVFECNDDTKTSIRLTFALKLPFELFRIWRRYRKV